MFPEIVFPWWAYPLIAWVLVWKGISMWKAGRNNQPIWFTVCFLVNTVGILPILYIAFFQEDRNVRQKKPMKRKKVAKRSRS